MTMHRTHFRTCNLCEAMCGLEIDIEGDTVTRIRGDQADAFSRGYHCIKGEALADLHADPKRLKRPMRRTAAGWEEVSWDVAIAEVTDNLDRLQRKYGKDAVATYIGNPNAHNYGSLIFLQGFLRQLRTRHRFAATSADQLPHHMVAFFLFGHQLLLPIPDIDRTDFMLILGANPVVSRGSLMSAPDVTTRLKAIRERGGKVVLIDPRRTETAAVADEHHFIRPGTDALLLMALLHVVMGEGLDKLEHLASFTDNVEIIRSMVLDYTPERVAPLTGIEAATIRELARSFAKAKSAVCYGRVGVSTQEFGAICQWLLTVLNVVTGNMDRAGGAMFTTPALDPLPYVSKGHFGRWKSRVRGLPEFAGELPVAVMAEDMLTPGEGQIKGLFTCAGNPVLSTPDGPKLERALAGLDYMVSIDIYLNETTRFAHHILPPTVGLEHENYDAAFHVLAVRDTAKFSPAAFASDPGARHDWQILSALQRRMMAKKSTFLWAKAQLLRVATPQRILALGLRFGPYGLSLRKLKRAPHGIDFGPLKPRLPSRLFTATRRIDVAPSVFVDDLQRLRQRWLESPVTVGADGELLLIGRRQVRVNNSWMGHIDRLTKGKSTCTALMHSQDAVTRGIKSGDKIRITSKVGSITIAAVVVDGIMPGVISVPHGFGHTKDGVRLDVAEHAKGVSANDLTDPGVVDLLSGNAVFNGVPVQVELVGR